MYTRCPDCRTPFKITPAQLAARDGVVRCGKCGTVFVASAQLLEPSGATDTPPADKVRERAPAKRRRRKSSRRAARAGPDPSIPTISELPFLPRRRRLHPLLAATLNTALLLLLAGQILFFYRDDIAQYELLNPAVTAFCRALDCAIAPPPRPPPPELIETSIAPHPRFANGLRIRAVMANRTARALPYPQLEVSLTDNNGTVLARRTFQPRQYLDQPPAAAAAMEPNIAVNALIDVTNPDGKAVGYEIRLLPPE